jgi:hypothetical protein
MAIKLPERICLLDLETEETKFKIPEKSKLAFVGIKIYTLHNRRYYPCKHKYYLTSQIAELEKFLKEFSGYIIGHNILQFDYRVLRPLLSLEGIIEKTVDTLAFLHGKNGKKFGGLSLDNLSRVNLGKGKTLDGKSISELWRKGKRKEVVQYNENDCMLTKELWWLLVNKRSIRIEYYDKYEQRRIDKSFIVWTDDISHLTGNRPLFTFKTWKQKIERDGYILEKEERRFYREGKEIGWFPETESMYHWFYCDQCKKTFLFESKIQRGFADHEIARCPECRKQFGEMRVDLGCTYIGEKNGNFGNGGCQGMIPETFRNVVLAHIESTRREWEHPFFSNKFFRKNCCEICGRNLTFVEESCANPVDGSLICVECLTAGRWSLSLK